MKHFFKKVGKAFISESSHPVPEKATTTFIIF